MEDTNQKSITPVKGFLPLLGTPSTPSSAAPKNHLAYASQSSQPVRAINTEPTATTAHISLPSKAILTPPTTPNKAEIERKRSSISSDTSKLVAAPTEELKSMLSVAVGLGANPTRVIEHMVENGMDVGPLAEVPETAKPFQKAYQLQGELGHGAWSTVYSACEVNNAPRVGGAMPPSPPTTPEGPSRRGSQKQALAVKVLARRDGRTILEQEARVLTYLHSHSKARHYLVPFHGFDDSRCSILMSAVPLNLEQYVKTATKSPMCTATMFSPVIGAAQWVDIATSLIQGLVFLKSKGCVHGDIKPSNILMESENNQANLIPLYCDFSSSHVLSSSSPSNNVEEINAVTTDYTSPELLRALHPRETAGGDRAIATCASDVFALGVSLLFSATGESPYSAAQIEMQKLGMAMEGKPLDYARYGNNASRVMKGRAVDRALRWAVEKDTEKRVDVGGWEGLMKGIAGSWKAEGWLSGGKSS